MPNAHVATSTILLLQLEWYDHSAEWYILHFGSNIYKIIYLLVSYSIQIHRSDAGWRSNSGII